MAQVQAEEVMGLGLQGIICGNCVLQRIKFLLFQNIFQVLEGKAGGVFGLLEFGKRQTELTDFTGNFGIVQKQGRDMIFHSILLLPQ